MISKNRFELSNVVSDDNRRELNKLLRGRAVCLASASPRRQAILKSCSVRFQVRPSGIEEPNATGPDWRRWVRRWSLRKAASLRSIGQASLIVGSDTIVVCGRRGLGKPLDAGNARDMLTLLSGRTHWVFSGVAAINARTGVHASGSEATQIRFRHLTRQEISEYVKSGEPMDKAGAYGIQGEAARFVADVKGPVDNVVGLPVGCLIQQLRRVL